MQMTRSQYYSIVIPVLGIIYLAVLFITDWNGTVAVVGGLLIGAMTILARLIPMGPSRRQRRRS